MRLITRPVPGIVRLIAGGLALMAAARCYSEPLAQAELLTTNGTVEAATPGANWASAPIGLKLMVADRLRTRALSVATLRLAELGRLRVKELTTLEILPPQASTSKATIDLKAGAIYFFTRGKPREFLLQTPYAIGASRGTEFLAEVGQDGRTVLTVFDGEVQLSNTLGSIMLTNGEQGSVEQGRPPVKATVIQANRIVQWWLYYPGVLDVDELDFTSAEQTTLAESASAYRRGDIKRALALYPASRIPQSEAERIYYAALLLSVGQVDKSEALLAGPDAHSQMATALRQVIAIVSSREVPSAPTPTLATEWLVLSYVQQPTNLATALHSAREAATRSPDFGYAWERVAELEFSFRHIQATREALENALRLSPRNAQALALRGFILAAENDIHAAKDEFELAIATDGDLGNAWLGRGLCRIHLGDDAGGLADLQTAAALEPNRSLLRSYLGKAFGNLYDEHRAEKELALARRLDANDPTSWLYSALLGFQENRVNEAVDELEKSQELNDNRRVYRSKLLLDEDSAAGSATLATIYGRAGMENFSTREAARAVSDDYGNYRAHLFLADSFNALQDPTRINLRYETAFLNEFLLANLLAPVGAGAFSQNVSQQEYSKLFEQNGVGFVSDSAYRSDGQFQQTATQFGLHDKTSYTLDFDYQNNAGIRPNNQFTSATGQISLKQQLSPQDSLLLQVLLADIHYGDIYQYYDLSAGVKTNFDFNEHQLPTLNIGYHREWAPGVHTLFLATRFSDEQRSSDNNFPVYQFTPANSFVNRESPGINRLAFDAPPFSYDYHNRFEIYGAELNQIFQDEKQTLVFGARFQDGQISAQDTLIPATIQSAYIPPGHSERENLERITGYAYYTAKLPGHLSLTAGAAWDSISFPRDYLDLPVLPGHRTRHDLGPKAALVWTPFTEATFRAIYAESIGGVVVDQSYRLEPVELAGFTQTFRDVIPLSAGSAGSAPRFRVLGSALDLKFKSNTYIGVQAQLLQSDVDKDLGVYQAGTSSPFPVTSTRQELKYKEPSIVFTLNQLVGDDWSLGVNYQFSRADLSIQFPQIPTPAIYPYDLNVRGELQQLTPYIVFNHPSGIFARAEAHWYSQNNLGYSTPLPGDDFYQVNLFAGYRFPHQHGDFTLALLNANGTDYHLNPLNLYSELPRKQVWSVRFRLNL